MRGERALVAGAFLVLLAGACASAGRRPERPAAPLPQVLPPPADLAPPPAPAPLPVLPAPAPPPAAPRTLPARIRVGLATDLVSVTLECCSAPAVAELGGERRVVHGPVVVRPAGSGAPPPVWRLQVAALREESEAATLAARLEALDGAHADARFDAASGLYRVRVGAWPTRERAEVAGRALQQRGLDAFWAVSEGRGPEHPALEVTIAGHAMRVPGRRFALHAPPGGDLPAAGRRVRGALVVWLNDRGALNLVNELPLEQYLRGVVPRELGPGSYPELEALKAQAVAARSYTLRNLGGFADEGYDLCSTPKCQVYGGVAAEHPLSDRAVAETAGEILVYAGEPIEALYSATCGGHTEDVETIFPLKREPYLRGVRCVEAGVARLPAPPAVQPRAELLAALAAAGARLERRAARFDDLRAGDLLVRELGAERGYRIERATATYRQSGEGDDGVRSQPLLLAPGDALRLDFAEGRLAAVTQIALAPGAGPERPHQRAAWTRFKTDVEIAASVRLRVPGFEFAGLDVVARGISGRVGRVRLIGRDRSTVEIAGLAVRWALDLPDTWFTVRRTRERGRAGWRFAGRGWGHGVGLCQVGSYAMARRGHDYRTILRHYYTGAVFETLAAGAGDPASSAAASRSAGAQP